MTRAVVASVIVGFATLGLGGCYYQNSPSEITNTQVDTTAFEPFVGQKVMLYLGSRPENATSYNWTWSNPGSPGQGGGVRTDEGTVTQAFGTLVEIRDGWLVLENPFQQNPASVVMVNAADVTAVVPWK